MRQQKTKEMEICFSFISYFSLDEILFNYSVCLLQSFTDPCWWEDELIQDGE